ncbi:MAG TPA: polysaccharide deacetylase family protein [Solirubrobacteraceae bacterium]|nr:polysaccharide deacetylase family protein [Solirubrobacteraceae bacterium]
MRPAATDLVAPVTRGACALLAPVNRRAAAAAGLAQTLPHAAGVALTFDDGPHPEGTPAILELLARHAARATFFVVGEQVRRRPQLIARAHDEGHRIALHGDRHELQLRRTPSALRNDLRRGTAAIEDAIGAPATWHRPPYGIYAPRGLQAVRQAGLEPLLWSRWGKDWRRLTTPARIAARATRALLPGDVILLHDADFYNARGSHRRTAVALEIILTELAARKLDTVLPDDVVASAHTG